MYNNPYNQYDNNPLNKELLEKIKEKEAILRNKIMEYNQIIQSMESENRHLKQKFKFEQKQHVGKNMTRQIWIRMQESFDTYRQQTDQQQDQIHDLKQQIQEIEADKQVYHNEINLLKQELKEEDKIKLENTKKEEQIKRLKNQISELEREYQRIQKMNAQTINNQTYNSQQQFQQQQNFVEDNLQYTVPIYIQAPQQNQQIQQPQYQQPLEQRRSPTPERIYVDSIQTDTVAQVPCYMPCYQQCVQPCYMPCYVQPCCPQPCQSPCSSNVYRHQQSGCYYRWK